MIHIKYGDKQPPREWLEKAQKLTAQLDAAPTKEERDRIIDANSGVWGELKDWLLELSHGKCWFSEAKDTYSHWEVEHFRPKKSARDLDGTERDGYCWLAFDWHNYRICGNVGNRKKGTFFPLCPGSQVGTFNARHLVQDEIFLLLDPTREGDPELLSFNEEGLATAMPGVGEWPTQRAEESIKRFKLNDHEPLREARQKHWKKCWARIEQARDALGTSPPTATSQEKLRTAFKELQEMLNPEQPFTAVVRECLNVSGERWAQRIASA
ncbi:MAG: hypothetical protein ABSG71_19925 [Thermodesulfobacteriota bacterium]|jgi:hypothetical protein